MPYPNAQSSKEVWKLAARQHGVIARSQLLELGYSTGAIKRRVASGRLHPLWRGVYVVGRPGVTRHGRWMAAVLTCGPPSVLSHASAAELFGMVAPGGGPVEVSVWDGRCPRCRPAIEVHRRTWLADGEVTARHGIPVTSPARTIVDMAPRLTRDHLEGAINEADKHDLIDPEALRMALDEFTGEAGVAIVRTTLDRRTFTLTDTELERRFLPIARSCGLPLPRTQDKLNGYRVDFYWPDLGLVVETDGLRYHRTPSQQAKDRARDQAHAAAGLTPLRFTRAQVRFEPEHVRRTLAAVAARLGVAG